MEGGAPKGRRLDGDSGMKESEDDRLKCTINESTLSTADAVPLPRVGKVASGASRIGFWRDEKERGRSSQVRRLRERPSAAKKGSQPRLAALGTSFHRKGLAWTLPPSYGRRCPEGAEVGWGKRDEKGREIVSGRRFTKAPSARKQLIKPIYSYKKRKSNAANDFNVIYRSGYRYMHEKSEDVHFYD